MGLEGHVNRVLKDSKLDEYYFWYWADGLNVLDEEEAKVIMKVLDESGEFGPTRYNPKTKQIEFGVHRQFFESKSYEEYWDYFKAGKEDPDET